MALHLNDECYLRAHLYAGMRTDKKGVRVSYIRPHAVHRLVWAAFNGPIPDGFDIHHEDGDRTHNDEENLFAVSKAENTQAREFCKLDKAKCSRIRTDYRYKESCTQQDLADRYNVSQSTISMILNNKTWKEEIMEVPF